MLCGAYILLEAHLQVKHDVGGRNLKGVTGRPSASKQAGLEQVSVSFDG